MNTFMKCAIIVLMAWFAQSSSNEKIENDWTRDHLQGKVLSYSQTVYEAIDRFGKTEKGEPVEWIWYATDNINDMNIQKKYDEKGNRIEINSYLSDGLQVPI